MVCVPYIVDQARPREILNVEITVKRPSSDRSFHRTLGKVSKDNIKREHESKLKGLKVTSRTHNLPLPACHWSNGFSFFFFFLAPAVISVVTLSLLDLPNRARITSAR